MKTIKYYFVIILFCTFSYAAVADWNLNKQESAITYLSNKILIGSLFSIYEQNQFMDIDGHIGKNGQVRLVVNMKSVDTKIPIRNERIMEHVFKVSEYPQAVITLEAGKQLTDIGKMAASGVQVHEVQAELNMVGKTQMVAGEVTMTLLTPDKLLVQTVKPILLDTQGYDMGTGFEALKNIAKLFNIPTTIPVSFTLVFTRG